MSSFQLDHRHLWHWLDWVALFLQLVEPCPGKEKPFLLRKCKKIKKTAPLPPHNNKNTKRKRRQPPHTNHTQQCYNKVDLYVPWTVLIPGFWVSLSLKTDVSPSALVMISMFLFLLPQPDTWKTDQNTSMVKILTLSTLRTQKQDGIGGNGWWGVGGEGAKSPVMNRQRVILHEINGICIWTYLLVL